LFRSDQISVGNNNFLLAFVLHSCCVVSQHAFTQNTVLIIDGSEANYWQTQERTVVRLQDAIIGASQTRVAGQEAQTSPTSIIRWAETVGDAFGTVQRALITELNDANFGAQVEAIINLWRTWRETFVGRRHKRFFAVPVAQVHRLTRYRTVPGIGE